MNEAVAGVLALLFCTTHLHYTQNMQENNYIMLLTLTGFSFQYEWLRSGSMRALFWIGRAWAEPVDSLDHRPRSDRGWHLPAGCALVRASARPRVVGRAC